MWIGLILIIGGTFLGYLKISKKILVNKKKYDFYLPPDEIRFWGGIIIIILSGLVLVIKNW